jgi:hypothetical protein
MVFDPPDRFFLRPSRLGLLSLIEGLPGTGKTILALKIAKRVVDAGRTVLFIPLEQTIESVGILLEQFSPEFGTFFEKSAFVVDGPLHKERERKRLQPEVPKQGHGGVAFFCERPANLHGLTASGLIMYIEDKMLALGREFNRKIDLVLVDNANVVPTRIQEPKGAVAKPIEEGGEREGPVSDHPSGGIEIDETEPIFERRFPFTRAHLHMIREHTRIHRTSVLMIIEGIPSEYEAEFVEYHADIIVRMLPCKEYSTFRVLKSRNRPTPPGEHVLVLSGGRVDVFPSPEVVTQCVATLIEHGALNSLPCDWARIEDGGEDRCARIKGWNATFPDILRSGDLVCVSGPASSGKSKLLRAMVLAVAGRHGRFVAFAQKQVDQFTKVLNDPGWHRNRVFMEVARVACEVAANGGVLGLDGLTRLAAGFPTIADDRQFVPSLFGLLRVIGCSVIVEAGGESVAARQALKLCDVAALLRNVSVEKGSLRVVSLSSSDYRPGLREVQVEVRFVPAHNDDFLDAEVTGRRLHLWKIPAEGAARRINVCLVLPSGSKAEDIHAKQLGLIAGQIVGSEQVRVVRVLSHGDFGSEDIDRPFSESQTPVVDRYAIGSVLASVAGVTRDDLTILVCEDHVLGVNTFDGKASNTAVLQHLEPLGTIDEWNEVFGHADERLIDPVCYNGDVVAVPYMIDVGCLVFRAAAVHERFKRFLEFESWREIQDVAEGRFGFNSRGRETRVCMLLEYLDAHGCLPCKQLSPVAMERILSLRALLGWTPDFSCGIPFCEDRGDKKGSFTVCREWFSKVSTFDALDHARLVSKGFGVNQLPSQGRYVVAVRYFVIPRGSTCRDLGVDLITEFVRKDLALERAQRFVGLSPYTTHYLEGAIRRVSWLGSGSRFASRDKFVESSFLRSGICDDYVNRSSLISDMIADLLFSDMSDQVDKTFKRLDEILKGGASLSDPSSVP